MIWREEKEWPWGTKAQLLDSTDKLDINLADAIALCSGNIDRQLLSSTGNLFLTIQSEAIHIIIAADFRKLTHLLRDTDLKDWLIRVVAEDGDEDLMGEGKEEAWTFFLLSFWVKEWIFDDNLQILEEDAIGTFKSKRWDRTI